MEKRRVEYIDILKAIAIMLVVFGHEIDYMMEYTTNADIMTSVSYVIKNTHMPIFFVVAGIFANRRTTQTLGRCIVNKFLRLMVPYFIWIFLLTLSNAILGPIVGTKANWSRLVRSPIEPFGQFWFLYVLFVIEVIYEVLVFVIKNNNICMGILFILAVVILGMSNVPQPFILNRFERNLIYFVIGLSTSRFFWKVIIKRLVREQVLLQQAVW